MKVLRIVVNGISGLNENTTIDFFCEQRVMLDNREKFYNVLPLKHFFLNNTIALTGINASGKTSVLNIIDFVFALVNNLPINTKERINALRGSEKCWFDVYLYTNNSEIVKLHTELRKIDSVNPELEYEYIITDESLWKKNAKASMTNNKVFDFNNTKPFVYRNNDDYLADDISIIIALNKKNKKDQFRYAYMAFETNINLPRIIKNFPKELIEFLDPKIESLAPISKGENVEKGAPLISLKMKDGKEIIANPIDLWNYLSSGTIKGLGHYTLALEILRSGGYFIIDEIENHFNRQIVMTLIDFFNDPRINKEGATLLFTTHYDELLDDFSRNDNIYFIENKENITVTKLSHILKRNDISRSEAYKSGFFGNTTISYEKYLDLKKLYISEVVKNHKG